MQRKDPNKIRCSSVNLIYKLSYKGLQDGEVGKGQNQKSRPTQAKKYNKNQAGIQMSTNSSNTQVR